MIVFRCYTNTRVAANSFPDSSLSSSEKSNSPKKIKTEAPEISVSSNESVKEVKPETFACKTVQDIPVSTNTKVPNVPHANQLNTTIKMEWKASDVSQVLSDDQSPNSTHCLSKRKLIENMSQYVCVVCDERFSNKCLLTMHQVQHIKSDRSCYGLFMAALARTA